MNVGRARWNIKALMEEIRGWLGDTEVCQPDSDGRVEFSISTISGGANGIHQPTDVFRTFDMPVPEDWAKEHPGQEYDPDEDEYFWEDADRVTGNEAGLITEALAANTDFAAEMEKVAPGGWSLYFGHRETDGDYCLFFAYTVTPDEGEQGA